MDGVSLNGIDTNGLNPEQVIPIGLTAYQGPLNVLIWLDAAVAALASPTTVTIKATDNSGRDVTHNLTLEGDAPFLTTPSDVTNGTDAQDNIDKSDATTRQLIQGGDHDDTIIASDHGDVIIGGYGIDTITLGDGADVVVHRILSSSGHFTNRDGGDYIHDFEIGKDKLLLVDENGTPLADWAAYIAGTKATNEISFDLIWDSGFQQIQGFGAFIGNPGYSDGTITGDISGSILTVNFKTPLSPVGVLTLDDLLPGSNEVKESSEPAVITTAFLGGEDFVDVIGVDELSTDYGITII